MCFKAIVQAIGIECYLVENDCDRDDIDRDDSVRDLLSKSQRRSIRCRRNRCHGANDVVVDDDVYSAGLAYEPMLDRIVCRRIGELLLLELDNQRD